MESKFTYNRGIVGVNGGIYSDIFFDVEGGIMSQKPVENKRETVVNRIFKELIPEQQVEEQAFESALRELQNPENVALSTELYDPQSEANLTTIADYFESRGLDLFAAIIRKNQNYKFTYAISKNRKSREEIIQAVSYATKEEIQEVEEVRRRPI